MLSIRTSCTKPVINLKFGVIEPKKKDLGP